MKEIKQEIKREYRSVFLNDPRTPQVSALKLLNRAAAAYEANNAQLAEQVVRAAVGVLEQGVRRNCYTYYTQANVELS